MAYKLVWQDLFDSNQINKEIWNIETGGHGFGNKENQFYTDREKNIFIKNQILHIVAHKEPYEICEYTSGKLTTKHKRHIQYGKIEVCAKVPKGKGTWPAIWFLGDKIKEVGWPMCGEIDLMEHVGKNPGYLHFSLHSHDYNHRKQNHPTFVHYDLNLLEDFHTYGLIWEKGIVTFLIDDKEIMTFHQYDKTSLEAWPFNQPYYLILNLAIGGTWGGEIDDSIFPVEFLIKSVKVYERSDKI